MACNEPRGRSGQQPANHGGRIFYSCQGSIPAVDRASKQDTSLQYSGTFVSGSNSSVTLFVDDGDLMVSKFFINGVDVAAGLAASVNANAASASIRLYPTGMRSGNQRMRSGNQTSWCGVRSVRRCLLRNQHSLTLSCSSRKVTVRHGSRLMGKRMGWRGRTISPPRLATMGRRLPSSRGRGESQ